MRRTSLYTPGFGLLLALALAASAAQAQSFPPGPGGGMPFPGGRGRGGMPGRGGPRWDGAPMPHVPDLSNPVRIILQHRAELQLSDTVAQQVESVARGLDQQNDTLIAVVRRALGEDEDTAAAGPSGDERRREARDPVRMRDRLNAIQPIARQIEKNDEAAWKSATALLSGAQRKQAEKIRKDDQKERERERQRWRNRGPQGGAPGEG